MAGVMEKLLIFHRLYKKKHDFARNDWDMIGLCNHLKGDVG
jgi:hypothetical protein